MIAALNFEQGFRGLLIGLIIVLVVVALKQEWNK